MVRICMHNCYVLLPPPAKKRALADCRSMILNDHLKFDIDCINFLFVHTYDYMFKKSVIGCTMTLMHCAHST